MAILDMRYCLSIKDLHVTGSGRSLQDRQKVAEVQIVTASLIVFMDMVVQDRNGAST